MISHNLEEVSQSCQSRETEELHVQDDWLQTMTGPTILYIYKALTVAVLEVNSI
jgi:hypothetical protein